MTGKVTVILVIFCATCCFATCTEIHKDSKVNRIYVPYQANSIYYPYQYAKSKKGSKVMVPVKMDTMPSLYLNEKTKTAQAPLVNFFDGAYPVYYTAGHANGHFNGKISVLE